MGLKELKEELVKVNNYLAEAEYSVKYLTGEIESTEKELAKDIEERRQYFKKNIEDLKKKIDRANNEDLRRVNMNFIKENEQRFAQEMQQFKTGPSVQYIEKCKGLLQNDQKTLVEVRERRGALIEKIKAISPNENIPEPKKFNPKNQFQTRTPRYNAGHYIGGILIWVVVIVFVLKACGKM